jgi:hypothetical protein
MLELGSMRLGNWVLDASTVTVVVLGGGFGLVWAMLDLLAYTQGWPRASVSGEGIAAPGRDAFGFFQILFYLPVYVTLFVVATLHLGGTAVVGLGLGLTVVLGCICASSTLGPPWASGTRCRVRERDRRVSAGLRARLERQ